MTTSQAWLLDCGNSLSIAVGFNEMVELLQNHNSYTVPGSPGYCSSLLVWQNNSLVPVMDLAMLAGKKPTDNEVPFVSILRYQEAPRMPLQHLGLKVKTAPRRIQINDEQVCDFPQGPNFSPLRPVTLSSVLHEENAVMIIDIAGLCSTEFRDLANAA
jgi:chemotaxis signal transduction protein